MQLRITAIGLLLLASCSSPSPTPAALIGDGVTERPDVLLLGEQHDAPSHQETHRQVVQALAADGRLATLALEMAEQGVSTAGLSRDASEAAIRSALRWDESGWPWAPYRPAVMAAVAAGVPVVGANLLRGLLRAAMTDVSLDTTLPGPAVEAQQQAVRVGHCGLLPESQIAPMTRVQIARDRAMAGTIAGQVVPGKTVLLIAGVGHVDPDGGVPRHLPAGLASKSVMLPAPLVQKRDYCEDMRRHLAPKHT